MMRSLWTGASGMTSQQLNVDTISNNIANVDTTGYKTERAEFQTLLYQTMATAADDNANNIKKPSNMQVGHGVRPVAISRDFGIGSLQRSGNKLDFALDGDGFFTVQQGNDTMYTRDGSFKTSDNGDGTVTIVTSDGYPVLDINGDQIVLNSTDNLSVNEQGKIYNQTATGNVDTGFQFNIVQFQNSNGLDVKGNNLYKETSISGIPLVESNGDTPTTSKVQEGFLEMSNVQVADEMVKLIVAQRAYELNSKSITTSDEMLQQANNLKK